MLIFTAVLSLILGMGLPTIASYIVVSSLLAPVIISLGQQNGLIVPLIAVHLFVFYFGIMADVTPPIGLASFAAAAVSGGDPAVPVQLQHGPIVDWHRHRRSLHGLHYCNHSDIIIHRWHARLFSFALTCMGFDAAYFDRVYLIQAVFLDGHGRPAL
jgi:hypothetical protein